MVSGWQFTAHLLPCGRAAATRQLNDNTMIARARSQSHQQAHDGQRSMPRYFFHQVTKTGLIHDPDGTDLPDLEHALREAIQDARHLMAEAIRAGHDISSRSVQICDETGSILMTFPFSEAVTPSG